MSSLKQAKMVSKMQLLAAFALIALIPIIKAGRLVQEDPSWSKTPTKVLVKEAPDDYVSNRRHSRQQKLGAKTHTTEQSHVSTRKTTRFPTTTPLASVTGTNKILTTLTPPPWQRKRARQYEGIDHRIINNEPNPMLSLPKESTDEQVGIPRGKRQFPVWTSYPPHQLDLQRFFFFQNITTPKYPYGKCRVSYGFDDNPRCLNGEVCVDKDSKQKIECPNGPGTACPACAPPAPTPPCPRGCALGTGCPPLTGDEDGVCTDPSREDEEYDFTFEMSSTKRTPMVFYPGTLGKGAACSVYGDLTDEAEKSNLEFAEKTKKLRTSSDSGNLGGSMCNWAQARLQCIPKTPRSSTTTIAGNAPTDADIEASKRPKGTCECMLALGELAATVDDENTGQKICYIPANKGTHSNCDHEIYPPYGSIEGVKKDGSPFHRISEPAAKFCVPNAECRAGYKYTGLRCQCKKKARWDAKTATCSRSVDLKMGNIGNNVMMGGIFMMRTILLLN